MDIYAKIGYMDEADHITNIYPLDVEALKDSFGRTCGAIAAMNSNKKDVIECEIVIIDREQNKEYKILFDIINYYNYNFVNVLFYDSLVSFERDYIRILANDIYEFDGVEISCYVPATMLTE